MGCGIGVLGCCVCIVGQAGYRVVRGRAFRVLGEVLNRVFGWWDVKF